MLEYELYRLKVKKILKISIICSIISLNISLSSIIANNSFDYLIPSSISSLLIGFLTPLLVQLIIVGLEASNRIRSIPRIFVVIISIIFIMVIISLLTTIMMTFLIFFIENKIPELAEIEKSIKFGLIVGAIISFLVNIYILFINYLGETFFKDLLFGKYATPSTKEAAIVFVDLVGSTGLAEKLKPSDFFSLLNDFIRIVELTANFTNGIIYKYLGDGVIIIWDLQNKKSDPLNFLLVLSREIEEKTDYFKKRYDEEIKFTSGLHIGSILVGEQGQHKKELGYWGDTINTSQRIQSYCKQANTSILISSEAINKLNILNNKHLEGFIINKLENVELKGKVDYLTLYSLNRKII